MPVIRQDCVGKPDAGKLACPVWRGLGGNVRRKMQRAVLLPYASLMLNAGIPVIVVSRRLGHARASITLDVYGHLIPSLQAEAAEKIDELVTPVAVEFDRKKIGP